MEKKMEKWESLRLEAQKFTPQEYCYTCWKLALECIGNDLNAAHHEAVIYDLEGHEIGKLNPSHGGAHPDIILYIGPTVDMPSFDAETIGQWSYYSDSGENINPGIGIGHAHHGEFQTKGYYWGNPSVHDGIHYANTLNIVGLEPGVS